MYEQSIPFTAYALISITSLVVTYSYITTNQEQDNDNNNEVNNSEMEKEEESQINSVTSITGTEVNPNLGENVPNFGGKKTKRKTRNKKYKNTKMKRRNLTNSRK